MSLIKKLGGYFKEKRDEKTKKLMMNLMQDIKQESRSPEYYRTDNASEINDSIYQKENNSIRINISKYKHGIVRYLDIIQIKKLNAYLYERAELWHQFRKEGLNMPQERLERLIVLEENLYGGEVDKILGMTEEFKIKQNKQIVLNPQDSIKNSTGDTLLKTEDAMITTADPGTPAESTKRRELMR